jgi:hypothetical protein
MLGTSVTKLIVPDWGDKVDSGKGFSYRPAMLHRLTGKCDNPMLESTVCPIQGLDRQNKSSGNFFSLREDVQQKKTFNATFCAFLTVPTDQ